MLYTPKAVISIFFSILTFGFYAQAMVPPENTEKLGLRASHIVRGYVVRVEEKIETLGHRKNNFYGVSMIVYDSEKGGFVKNNVVHFTFWRALSRSSEPAGSTGQTEIIKEHKTIKVWLGHDQNGRLFLLDPKGWIADDYANNPD